MWPLGVVVSLNATRPRKQSVGLIFAILVDQLLVVGFKGMGYKSEFKSGIE